MTTHAMIELAYPLPKAVRRAVFGDLAGATMGTCLAEAYPAAKQPDGDFTIKNIDIFRATSRKNPKTGKLNVFDADWLNGAVRNFEEQKLTGYLPPVHIDHHSEAGASQAFAGHIGDLWVDVGQNGVPELRANLIHMPKEVMKEIVTKRLPFRSLEVNNPDVQAVSSLALMRTVVPFHKLPLTRVSFDGDALDFRDRRDAVMFCERDYRDDADPRTAVSLIQRFQAGELKKFSAPINFAAPYQRQEEDQESASRQRQQFQKSPQQGVDNQPDGLQHPDGDYGDDLEELSPEELEAFLSEMESDGQDGGFGMGQFDPAEQQELQAQGETDMAGIAEGLNTLATAMTEGLQRLEAKIDTQGGATASPGGGDAPPVVSSEATAGRQQFKDNGDGTVTVTSSAWHGMLTFREVVDKKIKSLEQFQADVTSHFAETAFFADVDEQLASHYTRLDIDPASEVGRAIGIQAYKFAEAEYASGAKQADIPQYFSDLGPLANAAHDTVNPKPPADDSPTGSTATKATMSQAAATKFCDDNPEVKAAFARAQIHPTPAKVQAAKRVLETYTENEADFQAADISLGNQIFSEITD